MSSTVLGVKFCVGVVSALSVLACTVHYDLDPFQGQTSAELQIKV